MSSYQVLARKYRPKSFRELVGQEHVARALTNALDQSRLHHAYLFTGTRGVGKTTIARILAKCLNCETGVSSEPCGVCATCQEINEGRYVDLIEIDAASRTKVEDTREILDNVQYAPTRGRYKVYLIDEVHMLSTSSFNALLKTLEEPPPHVKFLLATTDPQKLPVTILSRCLQFALKPMSAERVVGHLRQVLDKEMVAYEDGALWELGRAANGSMRDALSLTDQAIAFGNGRLQEGDVRSMLGTIDRDQVFRVLASVLSGEASQIFAVTEQLTEQSVDFAGALAELVSLLHRVAVAQLMPDAVDNSMGDRERVLELARQSTAEDVQLYYQIAMHGRRDLPYAFDPRSGFEMTLIRMLAFKPMPSMPQTGGGKTASSTGAAARPAPVRPSGSGAQASAAVAIAPVLPREAAPAVVTLPSVTAQALPDNVVPLHPTRPVEAANEALNWLDLVQRSGLNGAPLNLARHAFLQKVGEGRYELQLSPMHEVLGNPAHVQAVALALAPLFQLEKVQLSLRIVKPEMETPIQIVNRRQEERRQRALCVFSEDPVVKALVRDFSAQIINESIEPLD